MSSSVVIIRLRGRAGGDWRIEQTLGLLRLNRRYSAMVYPYSEEIKGMIRKVEAYITWGELDEEGIDMLLNRMKTREGKKIDDETLKINLNMNIDDFKQKIVSGELRINKYSKLFNLPISLHPPREGFYGKVSVHFKNGGEYGYRGSYIKELLRRMV
ncbi:50S ribosomal protein L30 [Candidatus Acidianus copahuensis]|uniref:50S ribosomal protein L30 n=1 Tax=Candidatus Acidianus copahuensis TaxID=1160895 RepID=A0A031LM68_9CREN|nr:50S ribosomal protein L30 [Candidatus Acidianus copahuensis]EZQ03842.1 50S ribosomal protein L30 [Candidatus Acidianus copahuensis]